MTNKEGNITGTYAAYSTSLPNCPWLQASQLLSTFETQTAHRLPVKSEGYRHLLKFAALLNVAKLNFNVAIVGRVELQLFPYCWLKTEPMPVNTSGIGHRLNVL